MPDQPDDAPKRQQRGVFPPFFAPRNGSRPDGSPMHPSGSWRRVSRLFTPPEGTRQRRTPAVPQAPYTPPLSSAEPVVPAEPPTPAPEIEELSTPPSLEAPEAMVQAGDATEALETPAASLELEHAVSEEMATEVDAAAQKGDTGGVGEDVQTFYASSLEPGGDSLDAMAGLAFAPGVDDFVVESLEPQPISLDPSDAAGMDVAVESMDGLLAQSAAETAAEPLAPGVTYDEMFSPASYEGGGSVESTPTNEELESVERYLEDEPAFTNDQVGVAARGEEAIAEYERESLVEEDHPAAAISDGEPIVAGDSIGNEAAEIDPWAGTELPEPAFGSIGWPPSDAGAPVSDSVVDEVDEMSAALAWSADDHDVSTPGHRDRASHDDASGTDDDALSAMVGELRDSSSAWKSESDSIVDEKADVAARAHFYAAPEPIDPADELVAALEEDAYSIDHPDGSVGASAEAAAEAVAEPVLDAATEAVADVSGADAGHDAGDDAGAAIADALARVAARIRSGEVELPSEAAGTSDESALAAALAALLRGPRR